MCTPDTNTGWVKQLDQAIPIVLALGTFLICSFMVLCFFLLSLYLVL